jgi:hypothetical protein
MTSTFGEARSAMVTIVPLPLTELVTWGDQPLAPPRRCSIIHGSSVHPLAAGESSS